MFTTTKSTRLLPVNESAVPTSTPTALFLIALGLGLSTQYTAAAQPSATQLTPTQHPNDNPGIWVMLDRTGDVDVIPAEVTHAVQAALESALQEAGLGATAPITAQQRARRAPNYNPTCTTERCIAGLISALGATGTPIAGAIQIGLWNASSTEEPTQTYTMQLTLHTPAGTPFEASLEDPSPNPQTHIPTLLAQAHAALTRGPGPWLDIEGHPRNAQVYIDDTPMGTLPFHQKLNPGTYQVRIQLPGYETLNTTTTLENDPAQTEHLQVSLPN